MVKFKNLHRPRNKTDKENESLEQLPKKRKCQSLHYSPSPNDDNELSYEDAYSALQDEWSKQKPKRRVLEELLIATMNEQQTWVKRTGAKVKDVLEKFPMLTKKRWVSFLNNVTSTVCILN